MSPPTIRGQPAPESPLRTPAASFNQQSGEAGDRTASTSKFRKREDTMYRTTSQRNMTVIPLGGTKGVYYPDSDRSSRAHDTNSQHLSNASGGAALFSTLRKRDDPMYITLPGSTVPAIPFGSRGWMGSKNRFKTFPKQMESRTHRRSDDQQAPEGLSDVTTSQPAGLSSNERNTLTSGSLRFHPDTYKPPSGDYQDQLELAIVQMGTNFSDANCLRCGRSKADQHFDSATMSCSRPCVRCPDAPHDEPDCPRLYCTRVWHDKHGFGQCPPDILAQKGIRIRPTRNDVALLLEQGYEWARTIKMPHSVATSRPKRSANEAFGDTVGKDLQEENTRLKDKVWEQGVRADAENEVRRMAEYWVERSRDQVSEQEHELMAKRLATEASGDAVEDKKLAFLNLEIARMDLEFLSIKVGLLEHMEHTDASAANRAMSVEGQARRKTEIELQAMHAKVWRLERGKSANQKQLRLRESRDMQRRIERMMDNEHLGKNLQRRLLERDFMYPPQDELGAEPELLPSYEASHSECG